MPILLACSGPCVQFGMMHAHWFGWLTFSLALAMAVVLSLRALKDRRFGKLVGGWVCVAVHPGWWLSAYSGDCGSSRLLGGSTMTVGLLVVALGAGWFRPLERVGRTARLAATVGLTLLLLFATILAPLSMRTLDAEYGACLARADRERGLEH